VFKHDYKTIQSLKHAKYRKIYNKFIIEGKRIIESALYCNKKLGPVFCTDNFLKQNKTWIKKNFGDSKVIKTIDTKRFKRVSETKSPQGIFTVCNIPQNSRPDLSLDKWVYLDKISNPGNIGTLMRSCAWFGIDNIALSSGCVDPYNSKSVRSAMGAHFTVTINRNINLSYFKKTHRIIAANLNGVNASDYEFPDKFVLVLGNEAHGISYKNLKYIEENISVFKIGSGNSLNVSTAGSILMYLIMNN